MADIFTRYVIAKRTKSGDYVTDDRFEAFSLLPSQAKDYCNRPDVYVCHKRGNESFVLNFQDGSYRFERYVDKRWKEREHLRLCDGTYEPLPLSWCELDWPDPTAFHFPHISIESDICVAYTQDAAKGERDIQTRMRPGRYLTRFMPNLDSDRIRDLACEIDKAGDFKLASTRTEIRQVYCCGPGSCMSHGLLEYSSHVHPVEVYAAGDLAVAYLGDIGDRISARTLCWPDKKTYSLIYGDTHRLGAALKLAGYERGSLAGARLLKIPYDGDENYCGAFVMPYIDTHGHFTTHEDGKHFAISDTGEYACYTHGLSRDREEEEDSNEYCDGHGGHCDDTASFVQSVGCCCDAYIEENCYTCSGTGLIFDDNTDSAIVTEDSGATYSPAYARSHLFEHEGLWYRLEENVPRDETEDLLSEEVSP